MSELDELANAARATTNPPRRPMPSGRTALIAAVVSGMLLLVYLFAFPSDNRTLKRYESRMRELETARTLHGISSGEQAELDELHRRVGELRVGS